MTKVLDWLSAIVLTGVVIVGVVVGDWPMTFFWTLGAGVAWAIVFGARR